MIKKFYSIVIIPPENVCSFVRDIKYEVASEISPYSSLNSVAHISLFSFEADDEILFYWRKTLSNFCNSKISFKINLGEVKYFINSKVVYLALDSNSVAIVRTLRKQLLRKPEIIMPHMTIAKNLTNNQFQKAVNLLCKREYKIEFHCTRLTLRKYSEDKKHFLVSDKFYFD